MNKAPKLIVIVGETASGKSDLSMILAQRFNGEIICADSWTIYKELDIGTAKPTKSDREKIKHYLLDLKSPDDSFNAAQFKKLALRSIDKIAERDKLPIMVGGNGLYVDSVLFDYKFLPKGSEKTRKRLQQLSIDELVSIIEKRGYDLTGVDTRNKRRLIRVLESRGKRPERSATIRKNTLVLGIKMKRSELRKRIEQRADKMFRDGLKYEVKRLSEKYGWDTEALKAIGYREFKDYFSGDISLQKAKQRIIRSTITNLAKRQRSWFKKNPHIVWIEDKEEAIGKVEKFLLD